MRWGGLLLIMTGVALGLLSEGGRVEVQAEQEGSGTVIFREDFESGLSANWKVVPFHGKTRYDIVREGTNSVLRAVAERTASGLGIRTNLTAVPGMTLQWRWKIDGTPVGGSDREIRGFDHTARIFIAFHTAFGPPRSLNYVWANTMPPGKTFPHPHTGRAQFLAVETGGEKAGKWISESRDIYADYQRLFGSPPPRIEAIGFITDSDDTGEKVTGWYDDLEIVNK